ncbi:hypothetical protein YPPY47_4405, partial [Yersinia pestis PY-47]
MRRPARQRKKRTAGGGSAGPA